MYYHIKPDINTIGIFTDQDDTVIIDSENLVTIIKHNDTGISIDVYDRNLGEPSDESLVGNSQHWFNEYMKE